MIKQLLKKVLIIYLVVIACVFTPTYNAYAATPAGFIPQAVNWVNGAATLSAIKDGISVVAKVAPSAARVGKTVIGVGAGGLGVLFALNQITGLALSAVDYVFDNSTSTFKYKSSNNGFTFGNGVMYPSALLAAKAYADSRALAMGQTLASYTVNQNNSLSPDFFNVVYTFTDGSSYTANNQVVYFGGNADTDKSVSLDDVTNKVIANAAAGHADSQKLVAPTVIDAANAGEYDTQLKTAYDNAIADNSTHNCGTGTHWSGSACVADTPATPTTPTTDTPFDPSSILDAIGKVFDAVMSIPDVINTAIDDLLSDIKDFFQPVLDKFNDFVDWVKAEPTPENPTKPDVTTLPTPPTDSVNISFGGGCPAPKVVPWSLGGHNVDVTIPYTPICDTATLLNPLIKLVASLGAVFIIAGIRRGDDG